jgi:hypothetical protein
VREETWESRATPTVAPPARPRTASANVLAKRLHTEAVNRCDSDGDVSTPCNDTRQHA